MPIGVKAPALESEYPSMMLGPPVEPWTNPFGVTTTQVISKDTGAHAGFTKFVEGRLERAKSLDFRFLAEANRLPATPAREQIAIRSALE